MISFICIATLLATASAVRVQRGSGSGGYSGASSFTSASSSGGGNGGGSHFHSGGGSGGGGPFQANYGYCPPGCFSGGGGAPPGFIPPPSSNPDFQNFMDQYIRTMQQFHAQMANAGGNGYGFPGSYGYGGGNSGAGFTPNYNGGAVPSFNTGGGTGGYGGSNDIAGQVGASASGSISPTGGYGTASVNPPSPSGLDVRFGAPSPSSGPVNTVSGSVPPPSGGSVGVFSSSSSSSSNIDGKQTSYKTATVGFNDNGKVTTYTAHDP